MTLGKRFFDLVFVLIVAVISVVPFIIVVVIQLIVEGRPVFYVAERMKAPGKPFGLCKFRTMTVDPDDKGVSGAHKRRRVTRVGRVLRRFRLDETPQLWNVLKGDLSFVGPRPPLREYVERFPDLYAKVLQSRPGITGLATLHCHTQEERLLSACNTPEETDAVYCRRCIPRKARLDLIYARNRNLCFDMALMFQTLGRVFRRHKRHSRKTADS